MKVMQLSRPLILLVSYISLASAAENPIEVVPPVATALETFQLSQPIEAYCSKLEKKFQEYKWGNPKCDHFKWNHVRSTNVGTPLIWTVFGEEKSVAKENTTLIMCGVHGDEITPVKFCWDLINELKKNHTFHNNLVVVAPLVSPDSFFKKPKPTRTNAQGVDVNRNFPTQDWNAEAVKRWKQNYRSDWRKNPGPRGASEQETIFQMNLILRYKPNKIISVHAPLALLDYDGPSLRADNGKSAKVLLEQMSKKSEGYKISNYPIFPGSLGNWAGKEKHIPTYTLELANTDHTKTDYFWGLFKDAMIFAIENKLKPTVD
jgi:murein peptide amidase A